jgi:hypothetical protein
MIQFIHGKRRDVDRVPLQETESHKNVQGYYIHGDK